MWLGASDIQSEGSWIWNSNGNALSYTNFSQGEPNNSGGIENCLEMWLDNGEWNDQPCSDSSPYTFCEQTVYCS